MTPACSAQSGYEIRNAIVAPEYGNEEFAYSAEVWMSEDVAGETGAIAVTQFSLKLNIYNNGNEVHTDSIDQRGMSRTSFSFGPYNFKNRFAIAETENASFEFVFYSAGQVVARTRRMPGPIVKPPTITGVQFEKSPYFFQGLSAFPAIRDQEGLDPKPICHLVISGPLGTSENRTWNSDDVLCRASGKSAYTASLHEDLSSYRDGGNFSFMLVYSNLKTDPITSGPYSITLRPYAPVAESLKIDKDLDYTNFTIVASVKDASASMEESNPQARLIISHPQKGDLSYTPTDPLISGDKVIYRWTAENDPPLFNRSDVDLSKSAPFAARLEYTNDRWDFSANSSDVAFNVVEEVPKLSSQSIPESVYVSSGQTSLQQMTATIAFSKGPGQLDVRLTGPSMDFESPEEGIALGGNKYQYRWQVPFDDSHVNNNYTLSMSFIHDQVEGGRHDFEDKSIKVSPISVQFLDGDVDPEAGLWNDSYTYSARMDSTVPVKVQLQVYDPCSSDWINKQTKDAAVGTNTTLSWPPFRPFAYECDEMAGKAAKYRFKASYAGEEIASSRAYNGPRFLGAKPTLISLVPEGDTIVVYVSEEGASSSISAIVGYGGGQGEATLRLTEQDGSKSIEEQSTVVPLGEDRYRYDWTVPFDWADAGKSFNLALGYNHASLSEEEILAERTVNVVPVSIFFGEANVTPDKGRWNQSYDYSLPINSSVDATVALEVYNPCTHTWVQRASGMVSSGEKEFNETAQPFRSKCTDSEGKQASFRFVASFAGRTSESEVYFGPFISGGQPKLISVDFDPVLLVSEDSPDYQSVNAIVDFPQGQDGMQITIVSQDKAPATEEMDAVYLGGTQYLYTWSKEFGADDAGNHTISLHNVHPKTAGDEITFSGNMKVVLEETGSGMEPKAMGDVKYLPVLFVTPENPATQALSAEVFSPGGEGSMTLDLTGVDKKKEEEMTVTDLGDNRYRYDYSEQFDATNAGNSYILSLDYQFDGRIYSLFDDHIMQVALEGTTPEPVWEPNLTLEYDTTLYVPAGGKADQRILGTISYPERGGILKLNLTGPNKNYAEDLSGSVIGVDKHLYEAAVPFDESNAGNNFTISLAFNHSDLGGDYNFADHYMRVLKKSPGIGGNNGGNGGGLVNRVFNDSTVTVIGNVTPALGVIQAWDEKDPLHALTYTLQLLNWSSSQVPWVELSVKAYGADQPWKIVGEKKRLNPSTESVSWTLKPFWETPFIGKAEYRFLVDGAETQSFEGPEIIAVLSEAGGSLNKRIYNFKVTINSSENLTICLVGGDNRLPENIRSWTTKGQCQDYSSGAGEQTYRWTIPDAQAPPYYDFDIKVKEPLQ